MKYQEIEGNLITLAKSGAFDVIAHGCNCFSRMKRGIAPQMAEAFGCDHYPLEKHVEDGFWVDTKPGSIDKLGRIDYQQQYDDKGEPLVIVVNAYTQYQWSTETKPFDYDAFTLCMRKMNHEFKGQHIGLPQIGSHLAGGDWELIRPIIQREFKDCDVTVVIYKP